jgi:hypothetical protein
LVFGRDWFYLRFAGLGWVASFFHPSRCQMFDLVRHWLAFSRPGRSRQFLSRAAFRLFGYFQN